MAEPVSLEEVKTQIALLDDDTRDDYIEGLIVSARSWVEKESGQILVRRPFIDTFRRFYPYFELTKFPVVDVQSISYVDEAGVAQTVPAGDLTVQTGLYPARVYHAPGPWPTIFANSGLSINYTAGYEDSSPEEAYEIGRQAILLLVAHWWAHREGVSVTPHHEVPIGVRSLCHSIKVSV